MKQQQQSDRKLIFDEEGIKSFAIHLKKIRIREGYSQSQLAFESGLSLSQIARIETARINPTLSTVFVLARTLNVPLSDLFNFQLSPKEK
ncbi:MAG: helix-turn-helix transcriptional regulator [Bacteroidota bacterium]|nr:XRE family transcriptional regulator [Odoribacter sp.]MDP3642211.1 helix-turn-helix transcriptional regulator [Bacteroidota bacterium]